MSEANHLPPGVDTTTASTGRMYDYYLGGAEYLEVDRVAAERIRFLVPELNDIAWANRGFLQRAATWLARDAGVDQFIDIGAGLPTRNNTHEAAQSVSPDARVVYVDNDPMVLAHAHGLLHDVPNAALVDGDVRHPDALLGHPELRRYIDFDRPVGLMLVALVHFIGDEEDPWALVRQYVDALPSGSYLALSHVTGERANPETVGRVRKIYDGASEKLYFRGFAETARFFEGMEIVPPYHGAQPAVDYIGFWGAEDIELADSDGSRWGLCGVARKP